MCGTVAVSGANFAAGTVTNGQVMQFIVVPEPTALVLAAVGLATLFVRRQ